MLSNAAREMLLLWLVCSRTGVGSAEVAGEFLASQAKQEGRRHESFRKIPGQVDYHDPDHRSVRCIPGCHRMG